MPSDGAADRDFLLVHMRTPKAHPGGWKAPALEPRHGRLRAAGALRQHAVWVVGAERGVRWNAL